MWTNGQTGIMKLIVTLRNFVTAPKNQHHSGEFQVGIHEWRVVIKSGLPIAEWTSQLFQFILRWCSLDVPSLLY